MGHILIFPISDTTAPDLQDGNDRYILTPKIWKPHSDTYAMDEESMIDWEGNMLYAGP